MYQKLIFIGNLGSNPEQRFTPSGDPVTTFSVATSRKYGETDETTWFRVSVWGKQAEACSQYLHKGSKVLVEGRLKPGPDGSPRVFERKDGKCIVLDKNNRVHNWIHDDVLLPIFAQYTHWMPLPEPPEVV